MFDFDSIDWVTSDQHFGHMRIIELCERPFTSVGQMNGEMIARWNRVVKPEDTVLHLGDLALGDIEASVMLTSALNGRKLLIPGNHDRLSSLNKPAYIERFRPLYESAGWEILDETVTGTRHGIKIVASHYPFVGDSHDNDRHVDLRPTNNGFPLLHGHTHEPAFGRHGDTRSGLMFHVGVDAHDFTPVSMDTIDEWLADVIPF